jgi:cellulose synthase/poly-beta-1,6-N-acetylglucosamine synthase-like glycosyltransferase
MVIINWILIIAAAIYAGYIVFFFSGLWKLKPHQVNLSEYPFISVVVAARNEERVIKETLLSLARQNYPRDCYEIVVVNDRSTDSTGRIIQEMQQLVPNLRTITIVDRQENISPKKRALIEAVKTISSGYILTTDADCLHDKDWLASYVALIGDNLGIATGLTLFHLEEYRSGFERTWQNMQDIEYISEQLVAAGTIGHNVGFTANGNNMLFNRQLYDKYEHEAIQKQVISGDDFFIIQTAQKYRFRLRFSLNPATIVHTPPQRTLKEILNQRARWSSKISRASTPVVLFSANTFIYYLGITLYPLLLIFMPQSWAIFPLLFGIKIVADTSYIIYGYKKLGLRLRVIDYILLQLVHAPFIILCAIIGILFGFDWKGERYTIDSTKS